MTTLRGTVESEDHTAYVSGSDRKYLIITIGIITMVYIISMTTDCLGVVLELNGILAAVPLAYILPALCYLRLEEGSIFSSKKLAALGLLVAGVFVAVSGLLLLIFNDHSSGSCAHGQIMSYCVDNFTIPTTASTNTTPTPTPSMLPTNATTVTSKTTM